MTDAMFGIQTTSICGCSISDIQKTIETTLRQCPDSKIILVNSFAACFCLLWLYICPVLMLAHIQHDCQMLLPHLDHFWCTHIKIFLAVNQQRRVSARICPDVEVIWVGLAVRTQGRIGLGSFHKAETGCLGWFGPFESPPIPNLSPNQKCLVLHCRD